MCVVKLDLQSPKPPCVPRLVPHEILGLALSVWQLKKADFQFLVDKFAARLVTCDEKNITVMGRTSLVKSMLASFEIYLAHPSSSHPAHQRASTKSSSLPLGGNRQDHPCKMQSKVGDILSAPSIWGP
ncbi:hypothetical protein D1007_04278 [Hordeum vulgare]|nr:hypothetical protein D1007_04278 [Hordeum vulgare]